MGDFLTEHYSGLVDKVYAAGVDPEQWPDFLAGLSAAFGDGVCQFYIVDAASHRDPYVVNWGVSDKSVEDYGTHFVDKNPYPAIALSKCAVGQSLCALECLPADAGEKLEIYNDWMRPNGWSLTHLAAILLKDADRIGVVSVSPQSPNAGERIDEDLRNLSLLVPHVMRAVELNRAWAKSARAETSLEASLELMDAGVFVLDETGAVLHLNSLARTLVEQEGLLRIDTKGKLSCTVAQADGGLQKLFSSPGLLPGARNLVRMHSPRTANDFVAWVVAREFEKTDSPGSRGRLLAKIARPTRMLIVKRLSCVSDVSSDVAAAALGLTAAEAKIVSALAAGQPLFEYADGAGVSRHTVRKQLASVFDKTGVSSQSQLVALAGCLRELD